MPKVISAHSLQRSWTYRNRSRVSGFVVLTAWAYVALTRPWIPQDALDWIVDAAAWLAFLGGAALRLWATLWIAGRKKTSWSTTGPIAAAIPSTWGRSPWASAWLSFSRASSLQRAVGLLMLLYVWFVVPPRSGTCRSSARTTIEATVASSALDSAAQPAPPRRDFSPTRRPDALPPRMPENGRLAAAGGAGPVDVRSCRGTAWYNPSA